MQSDVTLPGEPGSFLRVSSHWRRIRLCNMSVVSADAGDVQSVPIQALSVDTSSQQALGRLAVDGDRQTRWHSGAVQSGQEWIEIDLGRMHDVIAVVLDLGEVPYDFGRELAVDCGFTRDTLELGPELTGKDTVFDRPRSAQILPFATPRSCRILRVRQTHESFENYWSVAEVAVLERSDHPNSAPGSEP
jgi:hypothetical protein